MYNLNESVFIYITVYSILVYTYSYSLLLYYNSVLIQMYFSGRSTKYTKIKVRWTFINMMTKASLGSVIRTYNTWCSPGSTVELSIVATCSILKGVYMYLMYSIYNSKRQIEETPLVELPLWYSVKGPSNPNPVDPVICSLYAPLFCVCFCVSSR